MKKPVSVMIERNQPHQPHCCRRGTKSSNRDRGRLRFGITKRTCRDRGEGHRSRPEPASHLEGPPVARGERLLLSSRSARPQWSHGVDDPPARQVEAWSGFRVANLTAAERTARLQQPWTGGAVYRAVDSATSEKGLVGGVDDDIHLLIDDVAEHDFKFHARAQITQAGPSRRLFFRIHDRRHGIYRSRWWAGGAQTRATEPPDAAPPARSRSHTGDRRS